MSTNRAAGIVVLLGCLFLSAGCATDKSYLVTTELNLDSNGQLVVSLQNQGKGDVPKRTGKIQIFVDNELLDEQQLAALPNQGFISAGGSATYTAPLRLTFDARKIGVFLDPDNTINDLNRFQKIYSHSVSTAPIRTAPDFRINDLTIAGNQFSVTLLNNGLAAAPSGQMLIFHMWVDDVRVPDWITTLNSALAPNATVILGPTTLPSVPMIGVKTILSTPSPLDEADAGNNVFYKTVQSMATMYGPYDALLQQDIFKNHIIWERIDGTVVSYANWSQQEQNDLHDAIYDWESGQEKYISGGLPPVLNSNGWMSPLDAWAIYRAWLVQSLWVEVHQKVGWSIASLNIMPNNDSTRPLLDSRSFLKRDYYGTGYGWNDTSSGAVAAWDPRMAYRFMQNMGLLRGSQMDTVLAVIDWTRGRVLHNTGRSSDFMNKYGYSVVPIDWALYPPHGEPNQAWGCRGIAGVFAYLLRAVNIPAVREHFFQIDPLTAAKTWDPSLADHNGVHFVSLGMHIAHGDDVFTAPLMPSGNYIFPTQLLFPDSVYGTSFYVPVGCDPYTCDIYSVSIDAQQAQQNEYNNLRRQLQIGDWQSTDYLLYQYAKGGSTLVDKLLTGYWDGTTLGLYNNMQLFTPAERAAMITHAQNALNGIGNGNANTGQQIVIDRYDNFGKNKNQ